MTKIFKTFLMLCLMLPMAAWGYANDVTETKKDGTPVLIIKGICHGSGDRGNAIHTTLEGNQLSVVFSENLGQVQVELTTATGAPVDFLSTLTPNGENIYIPNAGDYIVTFTLANGDEYYGEFTVTD
ncbi:MAG: hypothetical protein IJ057_08205 [Bacteroidales bacterium]|nr:hypothetical protein [Bacteroidales bacterium]